MDKLERVSTFGFSRSSSHGRKAQANTPNRCKFKNENPDNDAITDNVAGQAYVEQFGLEVFSRADNAVRANKASK